MFNFIDTCRLCTTDTKNGGIDCISNEKLNNIIRQLYQIDITANDQLSKEICNACYESVTKFYFHYEIVKTAQKNQHQFLKMQLTMAISKPKTEAKARDKDNDGDSDVEFVSMVSSAKTENGKSSGGVDRKHSVRISAVNPNRADDKRQSTSITMKNGNSKPVMTPRPTTMARCQPVPAPAPVPAPTANRILNVMQNVSHPPSAEAGTKTSTAMRTVNVVTRQNDGTVILRKVQMKRSATNQLPKPVQASASTTSSASITGPTPKRVKLDDKPVAVSPALRPKVIDPKHKVPTTTTVTATSPQVVVRPKAALEIRKVTRNRRTVVADNLQQQTDLEKVATMTPLSASEHQYAKRTTESEASVPDTEKPSPQTPLSATEHHYSKRNSESVPVPVRNRWRPTTATATVVATAADSTRTDEIKTVSMTMAPSSPILLNEVLRKMKPSIRVRSVQSLNNNTKNG